MGHRTARVAGGASFSDDPERAARFYGVLLGLETLGGAGGETAPFLLGLRNRVHVTVAELPAEARDRGSSPTWLPVFEVDSCQRACRTSVNLGGSVFFARSGHGHEWAALVARTGETFIATEPVEGRGPEGLGWCEVLSENPLGTATFYRGLFGWTLDDATDPAYPMLVAAGGPFAGCVELKPTLGDAAFLSAIGKTDDIVEDVPPHWMVYLKVDDVERATVRVNALGGRIVLSARPLPNGAPYVMVRDPLGVIVCLVQQTR